MMEENKRYEEAKQKVEAIKGFYIHLIVYILVNAVMFIINITTSPHYYWFIWPLIGWGLGLLGHAMSVFGLGGFLGKEWEEKKIRQIVEKMEKEEYKEPKS